MTPQTSAPRGEAHRFRVDDWTVDSSAGTLTRGDETRRLEPKVMEVLLDLVAHAGEVRSKEDLVETVWARTFVGEAALSRCISELRRALGDDARAPRYIETLPKRGYRLVAIVDAAADRAVPEAAGETPRTRPAWHTPLALGLVVLMFGAWWQSRPAAADRDIETVAVLALRALSDDPDQQFFAEGLTENLIAELARMKGLTVVSGMSSRDAGSFPGSAAEIAEDLGVDAVINGTVQRTEDRTLVTLELIQSDSDRLVWGGSYQERGTDWLMIEHEVAAQAAREIQLAITGAREPAARAELPEARRELDRGRTLATRGGPVDALRSLDHFRRALELDPGYAAAWAALADAQATLAWRNWSSPASAYAAAREAAHNALDHEPALAEAHAVLAAVAAERNQDWPEAERRFATAIELRPTSPLALERYGRYLRRLGRHAEAVQQSRAALALDPDSLSISVSHAWNLLLDGQPDAAREGFEAALALDSEFAQAYAGLCALDNMAGRYEEARRTCGRGAAMPGHELLLGPLAYAEAKANDEPAARATLARLQSRDPLASVLAVAAAHLGLDEPELAIAALELASTRRSLWLPALPGDPYLAPLLTEPRVARMLDELLLPSGR